MNDLQIKEQGSAIMDVVGNVVADQAKYQYESPSWSANIARRVVALAGGSIAGAGALAVFDQGVVSGTNFLTSVVIGRMCSKEELGIYYLAFSIALFLLGNLNRTVMSPYTIYCGRRTGSDADEYAGSVLAHHLALTVLSILGLLFVVVLVGTGMGPAGLRPVLWVLLGAVPLLLIRQFARDFAYAHLQLGRAIGLDSLAAVLQLSGLLVLARWRLLNVETAFAVTAVACAIATLGWVVTKEQAFVVSRERLACDWFHNWSFAKWTFASHLIGSAAVYVMPWIIVLYHGEAATGVFAASWSLAGLANTFVCGIDNFLTPKAARAYIEDGTAGLRRVLRWAAGLFIATVGSIFIVFVVLEGQIITLTFGQKYSAIGLIVPIFILSVLVRSLGMVAGNGLWALEQPRANFVADVSTLITTLASAFVLVPFMSVMGAAIATLAGVAVGTGMRCVSLRHALNTVDGAALA